MATTPKSKTIASPVALEAAAAAAEAAHAPAPEALAAPAAPAQEASSETLQLFGKLPKLEVPAALRDTAEKAVEQAKTAYERLRASAEEASDAIEESYGATSKGLAEISSKMVEAARAQTNAHFDFISALMGVKSVSQAVELHTTHVRQQLEALTSHSKEMATLTQQIATDSAKPYKAATEKLFKVA